MLRADKGLDYGRVMRVMGELNRAGLTRISLVTTGANAESAAAAVTDGSETGPSVRMLAEHRAVGGQEGRGFAIAVAAHVLILGLMSLQWTAGQRRFDNPPVANRKGVAQVNGVH